MCAPHHTNHTHSQPYPLYPTNPLPPQKKHQGGVVVFDLHSRILKWSQHLDLTTDNTTFKAHIFSPPTVADLDKDGKVRFWLRVSVFGACV